MSNQQGKGTNRKLVLASIMLAMFMSAIEGTIIATAMPSIVADLGGFSLFSWAFSVFLLAQAVTIPIYGKLADLYGRKPVFLFGVIIFLIGSVLCGTAHTMQFLIIFRLVQGLGAGAVQPIATTIVGDIFSLTERAKIQGYISSVWGVSSIIGPAIGAFFVQYVHWAWVFWVNIPIGILSMLGMWIFLKESVDRKKHEIDYLGSGLVFISVGSLMVVLIQGGTIWPWYSLQVLSLLAVSAIGTILFLLQERRTPEPVINLAIWKDNLISISNVATLTTGVIIIGITTFMPTYIQGVLHKSPLVAGFSLAFMSIGWPIAATLSGRLMFKYGFRVISIVGALWILTGTFFLATLTPEKGWLWGGLGAFLVGLGMGLARTVFIVAIQNSVDWKERGVATATNMFMNILGNTVGAALLGGILNSRLISLLKAAPLGNLPVNADLVNLLLEPLRRQNVPGSTLSQIESALSISLNTVYITVLGFALISLILILFFPKEQMRKNSNE